MRTSQSHPLKIAAVEAVPGYGRLGITFCPGKKQASALSGPWDRDLGADLAAIADWGAVAVISLIEDHEIEALGVSSLGAEVAERHMEWIHLPIRDVSVPGVAFEHAWKLHGPGIRARLRDGFNILVHCKGGLGRAGTIAARLLVELGTTPGEAIARVRSARPGAIETGAQEAYVRSFSAVEEDSPSADADAISDRAIGAFLGLAVGDAVGTTLEFRARDSYPPLEDMGGGGPFGLKAGEWTDDTAMALALADSLAQCRSFDAIDLMTRFVSWRDEGTYSCTRRCFDIGLTVSQALRRWEQTGDPIAGSLDPNAAGNGSLMRLAPVALRYWSDRDELRRVAAEQSRTTHGAAEAVSACVAFAETLAEAIEGQPRSNVLRNRYGPIAGAVGTIMAGSWRGKPRDKIQSSGYVAHSLEGALWSVARTTDFRSAVLTAANLGGDADTTAAIAGQLAGALYGLSGIPSEWLERLAWRHRLEATGRQLLQHASECLPETARAS
jgi:ADP-ribosyl-[dinitrogen reductase] hydrolase